MTQVRLADHSLAFDYEPACPTQSWKRSPVKSLREGVPVPTPKRWSPSGATRALAVLPVSSSSSASVPTHAVAQSSGVGHGRRARREFPSAVIADRLQLGYLIVTSLQHNAAAEDESAMVRG
jgi:hypothetical protein